MGAYEKSIRIVFKNFCDAMDSYSELRRQNRFAQAPAWEYDNLLWKIYDVPKRERGQSDFETHADPQGLREFFQKHTTVFNDAMVIAAVVINLDPTRSILYYEHVLKVLQRLQPSRESEQPTHMDLGVLLTALRGMSNDWW